MYAYPVVITACLFLSAGPAHDPELRNGTWVYKAGERDRYIWQAGKLVPDGSRSRSTQRRPPARK